MKKAIVMINPLASIRFILHKLSEYGFASIVISTRDPVSKYCDYYQLDIDELVLSSRNLEEDLDTIRSLMCNYDIVHGWAGSEMIDFQYSELLIHTLFPTTTNDPESSFLRDNKFNMNEKLKEIGLRHIEQELIVKDLPVEDKISITKRFFDIHRGAVVVKPNTGSSASESVFSPASFVELESYIVNMSSSVDMLIQRKIQGVEYVVDTISWKGEHQLSFSGCYQKNQKNGAFEYQSTHSLPLCREEVQQAYAYVKDVLNSLEFKFGFAHCELMEENGEFYLIELNPRISGAQGANCLMAQNQVGVDHVDSYLKCLGEEPIKHNNRKEYSLVYFFKNRIGKYNSVDTSLIESLKSIREITVLKKHYDSDDVKHTLMDVSMLVVLESNNESSLSSDFKQLEYLERTGAPFI